MDDTRATGWQPTDEHENLGRPPVATGQSLGDSVTGIIEDMQNIVRGEVELARTEIKEDVGKLGKAAGMVGAAVFLALVGFIFLMLGVTYLLNKSLEMWIAAGIVGLALLAIGVVLGITGRKQMQEANLVPEKTIESLKEDKEWASHQINSATK